MRLAIHGGFGLNELSVGAIAVNPKVLRSACYGGGFRFGLLLDISLRIISPSVFCDMIGFPSQPVPRPSIALAITHKLNTSSEYQK